MGDKKKGVVFEMIKPDALGDRIKIIDEIKSRGFTILYQKQKILTINEIKELYFKQCKEAYFKEMLSDLRAGKSELFILIAVDAINKARNMNGSTDPKEADPDTLRFKFGKSKGRNAVHCSDGDAEAKREILIFFPNIWEDIKQYFPEE